MDYGDSRVPERVWDKLHPEPNTGCWLWSGTLTSGYGHTYRDGGLCLVHRWLLEVATGVVGEKARHQCRQPPCANPDHLLWGSNSDNQLDSVRDGTHVWASKTHCPRGHAYTENNIYWRERPRRRTCSTCKRELDKINAREYRKRKRLAA